jgi:hypothetical protein
MAMDTPPVDLADVARRTGLDLAPDGKTFVHRETGQELVFVPGGSFVMGMTAEELCSALRAIAHDPDVLAWRSSHARRYEAARPARGVTVQPFLVGRSPILRRTARAAGVKSSTHETAEETGPTTAAAMTADAAASALAHFGWSLPTDAQWEWIARAGGADLWAGGDDFRDAVYAQIHAPRFDGSEAHCNRWRIWGLALGEWIAERSNEAPTRHRGGGVLHAPWQDSDEAIACLAGIASQDGAWRGVFTARPVVALPWLETALVAPDVPASASPPFEEAVAELEPVLREEIAARRKRDAEAAAKHARLRDELTKLRGAVESGTIRSAGEPGVYIVRLAKVNGVLRVGPDVPVLAPGDAVTVRVVGSGGVPEVELVSIDR